MKLLRSAPAACGAFCGYNSDVAIIRRSGIAGSRDALLLFVAGEPVRRRRSGKVGGSGGGRSVVGDRPHRQE